MKKSSYFWGGVRKLTLDSWPGKGLEWVLIPFTGDLI